MDLNKPRMHDFRIHYGYFLKNIWCRWCKITIQSTDLLRYHVKTDGVYKDLSLNQTTFDDGDHDKNSKCYFDYHKKVNGKMKDETAGVITKEFVVFKI